MKLAILSCNLGKLPKTTQPKKFRRLRTDEGLEERVSEELGSNILVVESSEE